MRKAFVVGHPVKHSRSPLIHGHWLAEHGIEGSYERIDVAPADFGRFVATLREGVYAGGNVTLPHKEAAFAAVDRRTDRAERLGAVNTLWFEAGSLVGDNTDVTGFMAHLDASLGTGWEAGVETALVVGAGGASRGIVAGLQERPIARILVTNRTPGKADDLVAAFRREVGPRLETLPWAERDRAVAEAGLIVNTTSLGMAGQPPFDLSLDAARDGTAVSDIVYVPLRTPLLAAAEARGLRTVDGLGMLLHQAAPGFARWFGVTPRVTPALRAIIEADISRA